jgi:hypothetical protein
MVEVSQIFSGAPVKALYYVPGPEETGIHIYSIETSAGSTLFEVDFEFAENGNDLWVLIHNFGLPNKESAGSEPPDFLRKFSSREIESAIDRIRQYFSGSEAKDSFPFSHPKTRVLGVKFSANWAAVKQT